MWVLRVQHSTHTRELHALIFKLHLWRTRGWMIFELFVILDVAIWNANYHLSHTSINTNYAAAVQSAKNCLPSILAHFRCGLVYFSYSHWWPEKKIQGKRAAPIFLCALHSITNSEILNSARDLNLEPRTAHDNTHICVLIIYGTCTRASVSLVCDHFFFSVFFF